MLVSSIDIQEGRVVQLRRGKDLVLSLDRDPVELAQELNRYGEVCVIDLDAAMQKGSNLPLVKEICRKVPVRVGGGIRDEIIAREVLKAGASKLILGTAASPDLLKRLPKQACMVALDQRNGKVVENGWTRTSEESYDERAARLAPYCSGFLMTFVNVEGTMQGIPIQAAIDFARSVDVPVTVAGGVASSDEVIQLSRAGLDVQVGMALYTGAINLAETLIDCLQFNQSGLLPTVVQDESGQLLMLAYSSPESLKQALQSGRGVYFSRSRARIWRKGDTSGAVQPLISCRVDCDRDAIVFTVRQEKAACHSGAYSCFGTSGSVMSRLFETIKQRKDALPASSYTTRLLRDRDMLISKINEEAAEVASFECRDNLRWEIADLLYFVSVLAVDEGLDWREVETELAGRFS